MTTLNPVTPHPTSPTAGEAPPERPKRIIPFIVTLGVMLVLVAGALLIRHAESGVNKVALSSLAKPVTVVAAQDTKYRGQRRYVGALRP